MGSGLATYFHVEARAEGHNRNRLVLQPVANLARIRLAEVSLSDPFSDETRHALHEVQEALDAAYERLK